MADAGGSFVKYLKRAFALRWNLGLFGVAVAFALISPAPDALVPIVVGLEGAYLLGMVSRPRFREYVDAQDAAAARTQREGSAVGLYAQLHAKLDLTDRQRFQRVVDRCESMRRLAKTVHATSTPDDDVRESALNRLLFFYLRLLVARRSLGQFLAQSNRDALQLQRANLAAQLAASEQGGDQRMVTSLQDTLKDLDTRIANLEKGEKDAQFVDLELTRIEGKVSALAETAITRQDPGELSAQVTAFTDTLRMSQDVASQMISLQDLELATAEAPPILGSGRLRQTS